MICNVVMLYLCVIRVRPQRRFFVVWIKAVSRKALQQVDQESCPAIRCPKNSVKNYMSDKIEYVVKASWRCLEIPSGGNVLGVFCFFYQVERDVHVVLLGELGFANQLSMNPGAHNVYRRLILPRDRP